jgi:probable F420-dependent oxidoreductase
MSIRIGIGAGLGRLWSPQDYWRWIDYCEENGIDSVWHSEQLLGTSLEPLSMLAALSARTSRMRFGTNALVLPFHEPLIVAKQLATIAFLSGGRIFPVVGLGLASDPYWAATGTNPRERGRRTDEAITLIRQLLQQDAVDFAGTYFRYRGAGIQPRPERPIPLWTGGHSEAAIRRTAALGDGWLGGPMKADKAGDVRRRIEAALAATGRSIEDDHFGVTLPLRIGAANDPPVIAAQQRLEKRLPDTELDELTGAFAVGTPDVIITLLREYVAAGISKFVVLPIADEATDLMTQTQLLVHHILPAVGNSG